MNKKETREANRIMVLSQLLAGGLITLVMLFINPIIACATFCITFFAIGLTPQFKSD